MGFLHTLYTLQEDKVLAIEDLEAEEFRFAELVWRRILTRPNATESDRLETSFYIWWALAEQHVEREYWPNWSLAVRKQTRTEQDISKLLETNHAACPLLFDAYIGVPETDVALCCAGLTLLSRKLPDIFVQSSKQLDPESDFMRKLSKRIGCIKMRLHRAENPSTTQQGIPDKAKELVVLQDTASYPPQHSLRYPWLLAKRAIPPSKPHSPEKAPLPSAPPPSLPLRSIPGRPLTSDPVSQVTVAPGLETNVLDPWSRRLIRHGAYKGGIVDPLIPLRTTPAAVSTKANTCSKKHVQLGATLAQPDSTGFDVLEEKQASAGEDRHVKVWFERHKNEVQYFMDQKRRDRDVKIKVAILDTGFDSENQDRLVQHIWKDIAAKERWRSWAANPMIMKDTDGHGTHCALSLKEVAPAAELYIGRVCTDGNDLIGQTVAEAITHCVDVWNVDIISMSFGFRPGSLAIRTIAPAIAHAAKHNKLMFAAAGNGGTGNPRTYPATDDNVFCVFSASSRGIPSSTNPNPLRNDWNFCSMGEHVTMPRSGTSQRTLSGSSIATPIAAGFAALVLEYGNQAKIPGQLSIREPAKLRTMRGMRAVFLKMIEHDANVVRERNWRPIEPWNLLAVPPHLMTGNDEDELEQRRTRVPVDINRALESVH